MKNKMILGPVQMLLSAIAFAIMTYLAKLISSEISGAEVAFFRLFFGVMAVLLLACFRFVDITSNKKGLLVARGVFGGAAVLLFFLGIEKGTLTNSTVLNNTHPIFAAIISMIIIKEKLTLKIAACMLTAWIGIIVLIRPDINSIRIADLLSLASGVLGGFAITSVRQLRKNNESSWTIFLYFCIFGMVASLIYSIPIWKWPSLHQYVLLALVGLFGLLGQVMMTSAYKYCKAAVGGVLSMSTSVFTVIIGIFMLNENPNMFDIIGAGLIIAGSVMTVVFERPEG